MRNQCSVRKYGTEKYEWLHLKTGLSPRKAVELAESLRAEFAKEFRYRSIASWGLANPFLSQEARQILVNDARRYHDVHA